MSASASPRTRVLLTGATGNWGRAALRELRTRAGRIEVVALARRTPRDEAVVPLLVLSLKHSDDLADALAARGVE